MIIEALKKLVLNKDLEKEEIKACLEEIMTKKATNAQTAAFLTALTMKKETVNEILACVEFLKEKGLKLNLKNKNVIDIVGTGGDHSNTFNISTATAFVVAAGGIKVAKHGSRASSSKSGAADFLEAIGANIMLDVNENEEMLEKTGICFMFAQKFNPLMKNSADVRKEIKIRTIFNCLGPLINPSGATMQLIGVYNKDLVETSAYVMKNLGIQSGMTLFGETGLDEASVVSKTFFAKIKDGNITTGEFCPEDFGIKRADISDLRGGDSFENAKIVKGIFENKIKGAKLDVILLNAALSFVVAQKTETIEAGLTLAETLIKEGLALNKMNEFIKGTNEYLR